MTLPQTTTIDNVSTTTVQYSKFESVDMEALRPAGTVFVPDVDGGAVFLLSDSLPNFYVPRHLCGCPVPRGLRNIRQ